VMYGGKDGRHSRRASPLMVREGFTRSVPQLPLLSPGECHLTR
jgi:hypothetical protein